MNGTKKAECIREKSIVHDIFWINQKYFDPSLAVGQGLGLLILW